MIKRKSVFAIINDYIDKVFFLYKQYQRNMIVKKKQAWVKKQAKNPDEKLKEEKEKRKNLEILKDYLTKAGYDFVDERKFSFTVKKISVIVSIIFSLALTILLFMLKMYSFKIIFYLILILGLIFGLVVGLVWIGIYLFLDLKIFQRTKQVEDVLPDFMQLTSANISAGMPIDQALWFAVRPKFGVLAKEIEQVAKSTIAGADLEIALKDFSKKYDSVILKRSVNLMMEGMKAGGEMAELLSKIAIDIQETKLMKKDIAASVMTYVIFISFATIAAAPFLFALSTQLLAIIQSIMGGMDLGQVSSGAFNINVSGDSIDIIDFKIFSILALSVSAIFSASIVSVIRKGNVKEGLKYIPMFLFVSLILYFIANALLSTMMGSFI